ERYEGLSQCVGCTVLSVREGVVYNSPKLEYNSGSVAVMSSSTSNMFCSRCNEGFEEREKIVNSAYLALEWVEPSVNIRGGEVWHQSCFVCAQCFRPFSKDAIFYEFEGRKYCEHDFHVLFAPCCGLCHEFVIGRVIKALNNNWHPMCFRCELCQTPLADQGFFKNTDVNNGKDCRLPEGIAAVN
ncbi:unnamed protein product, partial [Medioppia subpectinata]